MPPVTNYVVPGPTKTPRDKDRVIRYRQAALRNMKSTKMPKQGGVVNKKDPFTKLKPWGR